jgi:hypothetical protein
MGVLEASVRSEQALEDSQKPAPAGLFPLMAGETFDKD